MFTASTREKCGLIGVICWNLWNRHNKWVWDKVCISVFGVKSAAFNLLTDWQNAQESSVIIGIAVRIVPMKHWEKSPHGWESEYRCFNLTGHKLHWNRKCSP